MSFTRNSSGTLVHIHLSFLSHCGLTISWSKEWNWYAPADLCSRKKKRKKKNPGGQWFVQSSLKRPRIQGHHNHNHQWRTTTCWITSLVAQTPQHPSPVFWSLHLGITFSFASFCFVLCLNFVTQSRRNNTQTKFRFTRLEFFYDIFVTPSYHQAQLASVQEQSRRTAGCVNENKTLPERSSGASVLWDKTGEQINSPTLANQIAVTSTTVVASGAGRFWNWFWHATAAKQPRKLIDELRATERAV